MITAEIKVTIQDKQIEIVDHLTYLGSVVSSDADADAESDINWKTGKATVFFQRLCPSW